MNERAFIDQLESADPAELAEILRRPSLEENRVLQTYFGAARLERLRRLALTPSRRAVPRGNVVVLHGIMGGELTVFPPGENSQHIWANIPRLAVGGLGWLRMTPAPASQFNIEATGILKKWYSEMLLGLAADRWNVQSFWYDWRLDLAVSADSLRAHIKKWFREDEPVHLVAHSMGGLVARTYILQHPERWKRGGKLIMLGTPNHGSFAIPQVITGAYDMVRKLAMVDFTHNRQDLLGILNTFPGSMQMLPSPRIMPKMAEFYQAARWKGFGVAQKVLDLGKISHDRLGPIVDAKRMAYIAGCNIPTKCDVADWNKLDDPSGYKDSLDGDGTVPHVLGFLKDGARQVPTYFVECEHGALPNHADVIAGTQQLLVSDICSLPAKPPGKRGIRSAQALAEAQAARARSEEEELRVLLPRVRARARSVPPDRQVLTAEEVRASELLLRGFLSTEEEVEGGGRLGRGEGEGEGGGRPGQDAKGEGGGRSGRSRPGSKRIKTPEIILRVLRGGIQDAHIPGVEIDAISVGHYAGIAPQNAELKLDEAISAVDGKPSGPEDLLITALHRRGAISGELGQNYQLMDPRDLRRLIVIAGMGRFGNFREAALTLLAQQLIWSMGRLQRPNLLTVAIGAGSGNLLHRVALCAWLRGARRALYEAAAAKVPRIASLNFIDISAQSFLMLHEAAKNAVQEFANDRESPLIIHYEEPSKAVVTAAEETARAEACDEGIRSFESLRVSKERGDEEPVRMTVGRKRDVYEFGAITKEASIPLRETQIDPSLIDEANNLLPEAPDFAAQSDYGNLLGRLLLPRELREAVIREGIPLVVAVDAGTARIHWEMVALRPAAGDQKFDPNRFLGSACGLTRQLRTKFAPIPEAAM